MRKWPRTVLFDFDGVIVNSEPLHFLAFAQVLAAERISITEDEYYREMLGFDDRGAFKYIYQKHGRPLEPPTFLRVLTRKSEAMMGLIQRRQYRPLPGVEQFVRGFWRQCTLGICSGALREEIEAMLEGVSLRDCFPVIVAAEDVTVGKPNPQGYLKALKLVSEKAKAKLEPADALIVEDAPTVIREVRAAGFPVLAVTTSHPAERLTEANWVVKSLEAEEVARAAPELARPG